MSVNPPRLRGENGSKIHRSEQNDSCRSDSLAEGETVHLSSAAFLAQKNLIVDSGRRLGAPELVGQRPGSTHSDVSRIRIRRFTIDPVEIHSFMCHHRRIKS